MSDRPGRARRGIPQRILVGVDGSAKAEAGLRRATALAVAERAQLTIVHVAVAPQIWVGLGTPLFPPMDDVVKVGTALVRRAVDGVPPGVAVRWHLITGTDAACGAYRAQRVRRALRRALEDGGHDLLVLGTGIAPGRVARVLLRQCPGRVLAVPREPQPEVIGWNVPAMLPPTAA